ncbi:hypothetical protein [Desulfoluna spongiiphila]|uniref:Uncharacterized protein n=1 Tax=Desulfoluna spongiiphila TaxID=419481 RepID=A0A1G5CHX9_9BACT|nr:hypothetical protein [Desulfoluna spongiiphila]SCY01901.1 hypothetical protein SAMN05216233_10326 [Desulfoluna spongiiphila]
MLSFEEHQELGSDLQDVYNLLVKSSTTLSRKYPKSSEQAKMATEANELVLKIRSLMDNVAFKEYPQKEKEVVNRLYFPGKSNPDQ